MDEINKTIFDKYQKGLDYFLNENMFENCERCHDFYIGNQWALMEEGDELPVINFIKPICKYKISSIAQNSMGIVYSPHIRDEKSNSLCKVLNSFASEQWDKLRMDYHIWRLIKNACITGDHYMYFFAEEAKGQSGGYSLKMRLIDRTDIFFADETNPDINSQEYIIIAERLPLYKVHEMARNYGLSEEEIALITSDEDNFIYTNTPKNEDLYGEYCTSLLYMELTPEGVTFSRSVREVVYAPLQLIKGLSVYPIAGYIWEEKHGSARGVGNVEKLIPNQLEVNKTLARRSVMTKRDAYNKLAYDKNKIANIDDLDRAGAKIEVDNLEGNPIDTIIQYLKPAPISQDASNLQNELIDLSRSMEGATDAAVGLVDPTKASGAAIKAARDQAAVPLNEHVASYKQFVEDVAVIWLSLWRIYYTEGISAQGGALTNNFINQRELATTEINIRVDVTPIDPYSRLSGELALERVLERGFISFEEYLTLLDDYSSVPKRQLEEVIKSRENTPGKEKSNGML